MRRVLMPMFTLTIVLALAACSTAPKGKPVLEDALTFDGLARVKDPTAGAAWMRPDFSLAGYTKIMLRGAGIEYKPVPRNARGTFPLTEKQKERLRQIVGDAFKAELAKSKIFQLVAEPGPDVLTIWGGLIDVVSNVPPESKGGGRTDIYLRSVGEATLVLEIRDSESNATLVRVLDRRAAESGVTMESNPVTNWSEVQRLARSWATTLRERLDAASAWAQ